MPTTGRVHSIETCGTVDGPGIRYVLFLAGCPLRCRYCHNCDTWSWKAGKIMDIDEIMADIRKYKPYFRFSKGGVTISGGEPTMQYEFLAELLKQCKAEGIHTCVDTSGYCDEEKAESFLPYTDLVLLDIKQMDDEKHRDLTGVSNGKILKFAEKLAERGIPAWIRYVVVPGYSDNPEDVEKLCQFVLRLNNIEKVELLPYHKMGMDKWEEVGLTYTLKDVSPPSKEMMDQIKGIFLKHHIHVM